MKIDWVKKIYIKKEKKQVSTSTTRFNTQVVAAAQNWKMLSPSVHVIRHRLSLSSSSCSCEWFVIKSHNLIWSLADLEKSEMLCVPRSFVFFIQKIYYIGVSFQKSVQWQWLSQNSIRRIITSEETHFSLKKKTFLFSSFETELDHTKMDAALLEKGTLFIRNKEVFGKKLLIFKAKHHQKGTIEMDQLQKFIVYWFERIER